MSVSTAVLRELHRIHEQLSDLQERLERGPRQVKLRQATIEQKQAQLANAQEHVKQTKKSADQKQLDLRSGENKIEDLKNKLNACSSNKEYQSLLEQIAAAEMANSVLADEILEALERADQLENEVKTAEREVSDAQRDLETFREKIAGEAEGIRSEMERLQGELVQAEKRLPADFKKDYDRVIRLKGAEGMAEVEDLVCQGCGKQITLNMQNELLLSKPVFCKSCGCLLYLAES